MKKATTLIAVFCAVIFLQGCGYLSAWLIPGWHTTIQQPTIMELPKDNVQIKPTDKVFIIELPGNGQIKSYYDHTIPQTITSDIPALRKELKEGRKKYNKDLLVIIKASDKASYKELINMLDEMTINNISRYSLQDGKQVKK